MRTQSSSQLQTVFGGEFVQEQHLDDTHRFLKHSDFDRSVSPRTASTLIKLVKSLRALIDRSKKFSVFKLEHG
jgi:hypothetical protein